MVVTREDAATPGRAQTVVIDCDIHNRWPSDAALDPYLPARWLRHRQRFGSRAYSGAHYPTASPNAARGDAWPPNGRPPGSDLPFLRAQLLDTWGVEFGILNPFVPAARQLNLEYGAALASAVNDWQAAEWLDPEPRLRASIVVNYEDGEMAAREIERWRDDRRFVQVLVFARTAEPLGRRKYWPMYEAAVRHGLPIGVHFGDSGGGPPTGAGWPSFYLEDHGGMPSAFEAQVISLVCEGVFERFPTLRFALIEGGFAWMPALAWRLDRAWRTLRDEIPHVRRLPSEYIRQHIWLTTQPMDEPEVRHHFHRVVDRIGADRLMFATDYPHWDFDAPDAAVPVPLSEEVERKIMAENARTFYRL
jgi:predicted TIM-barrel fold metal-dependent hydrolase